MFEFVLLLIVAAYLFGIYKDSISRQEKRQAVFKEHLIEDRTELLYQAFGIYKEFETFHFDGEYFYWPNGMMHYSKVSKICLISDKEVILDERNTDLPHTITYKYYTTYGNPSQRMDRRNPKTYHSIRCVFRFKGEKTFDMIGFVDSYTSMSLNNINDFLSLAAKYDLEKHFLEYKTAYNNLKQIQKEYDEAIMRDKKIESALAASNRLADQKDFSDKIREEQKLLSIKIKNLKMKMSTEEANKLKVVQQLKDLKAIEDFKSI